MTTKVKTHQLHQAHRLCDIQQLRVLNQAWLQVVEVYSGMPNIEEYLQAYLRLASLSGTAVSRVCASHCSKVVEAAGAHQYDTCLDLHA